MSACTAFPDPTRPDTPEQPTTQEDTAEEPDAYDPEYMAFFHAMEEVNEMFPQ